MNRQCLDHEFVNKLSLFVFWLQTNQTEWHFVEKNLENIILGLWFISLPLQCMVETWEVETLLRYPDRPLGLDWLIGNSLGDCRDARPPPPPPAQWPPGPPFQSLTGTVEHCGIFAGLFLYKYWKTKFFEINAFPIFKKIEIDIIIWRSELLSISESY